MFCSNVFFLVFGFILKKHNPMIGDLSLELVNGRLTDVDSVILKTSDFLQEINQLEQYLHQNSTYVPCNIIWKIEKVLRLLEILLEDSIYDPAKIRILSASLSPVMSSIMVANLALHVRKVRLVIEKRHDTLETMFLSFALNESMPDEKSYGVFARILKQGQGKIPEKYRTILKATGAVAAHVGIEQKIIRVNIHPERRLFFEHALANNKDLAAVRELIELVDVTFLEAIEL